MSFTKKNSPVIIEPTVAIPVPCLLKVSSPKDGARECAGRRAAGAAPASLSPARGAGGAGLSPSPRGRAGVNLALSPGSQFGLSPKSMQAFEMRNEFRFGLYDPTLHFSDEEDDDASQRPAAHDQDDYSSFEPYTSSAEGDDEDDYGAYQDPAPDHTETEETGLFELEFADPSMKYFWFNHECKSHLKLIFEDYEKAMQLKQENHKTDARRLPTFIGRVKRSPVNDPKNTAQLVTYDEVEVYRRDIRPAGSAITQLDTAYFLTNWSRDGLQEAKVLLSKERDIHKWRARLSDQMPPSFIYCLPVWESRTDFEYEVGSVKKELSYAHQPFNYTAYLPKDLFDSEANCDEECS
eukprot:TRINITY_DN3619_c0_g1_i3.p1 TRINITY_DN3619_c0_g1~~TRINITY_DN3619_c0_g1_i3.p1  ORF type:complete len:351 (-),score=34.85 TRINITY_DN3619_c0_g1_i3:142-1194(-)